MASKEDPVASTPQAQNEAGNEEKPVVKELRSTGNRWTDLKLAARRINPAEDFKHIGEIPCARNSLLMGIGAGAGIGFVRGFNSKPFVAANWAVGTFLFVAAGSWHMCRSAMQREREKVQLVVEQMAERRLRKAPASVDSNAQGTDKT